MAPGHALDEASADVRRLVSELHMPPGYTVRLQGQTRNLEETTDNLVMAIALASIFVYMVLAAQFESFVQPVIIMAVLPLSVPFALFTIWAHGAHAQFVERARHPPPLRDRQKEFDSAGGLHERAAVAEGCRWKKPSPRRARTRLRPILMTTSAIVAGLIPTALGIGIGGAQRSAIAITIIGGQSLCLFLTLLLVPAAYAKLDALEQSLANQRLKVWTSKLKFGRSRPAPESR